MNQMNQPMNTPTGEMNQQTGMQPGVNPTNNIDNDESWLPLTPVFQFFVDNNDPQPHQLDCRANILNSLHNQDRVLRDFSCNISNRRCRLTFMDGQTVLEKHDKKAGHVLWQKFCHNGGLGDSDSYRSKDFCVWADRPNEKQSYDDHVKIGQGQECGASFKGVDCHTCHKSTCERGGTLIPGFSALCQRNGQDAEVKLCFPSKTDIPLWTVNVQGTEGVSFFGGFVVMMEFFFLAGLLGMLALWVYKKHQRGESLNPVDLLRRQSLPASDGTGGGDPRMWAAREFQMNSFEDSSSGSFQPQPQGSFL